MYFANRAVVIVARVFDRIAAYGFAVMVIVLVGNIAGTRLFGAPVTWSVDAVRVINLTAVSLALAACHIKGMYVAVDFLVSRFSERVRLTLYTITRTISALLLSLVAGYTVLLGIDLLEAGKVLGMTPLPQGAFTFILALGLFWLVLVLIGDVYSSGAKRQ